MSEVQRLSLDMKYPFQYMENNEGNLCYYADYAALKAERDALADENANLKHLLSMIAETGNANFGRTTLYTPATDAHLNSVRAEGIQMAIDNLKALDASPYAIHSLECKLHGLRAGEPS